MSKLKKHFKRTQVISKHIEDKIIEFCDYIPNLLIVDRTRVRGISPSLINEFIDDYTGEVKEELNKDILIKGIIEDENKARDINDADGSHSKRIWGKYHVISFNEGSSKREVLADIAHELAHLFDKENTEVFPDIFATLIYKQCLGKKSSFKENNIDRLVLFRNPEGYTEDALEFLEVKIEEDESLLDLSLEETIKKTQELVTEYGYTKEVRNSLKEAFAPVASVFEKDNDDYAIFLETVKVSKKHPKESLIYKTARKFLDSF